MRNYELMRNILKKVAKENKALTLNDFSHYGSFEELHEELNRLKHEGLIEHNMTWTYGTFDGGKVTAITEDGRAFYRNLENEKVWGLIQDTLKDADLDLSYPLLKEVCDEIVKRYVMGKIPKSI